MPPNLIIFVLHGILHTCSSPVFSPFLTSCTTSAIPHRLRWSCEQIHQWLRICSVVIILLPCWRSLISLILSWFVEIISNTCLIKSSKARLYVPDRFRITMIASLLYPVAIRWNAYSCLFPEKSASAHTVPPYHSLEVTFVTLRNSQYIPPNHWKLGLCKQMS